MTDRYSASPNQSQPPKWCDPADAARSWSWIREVLKPLGMTVLVVETEANPQEAGWPHLGGVIGNRLREAELGQFDSVQRDGAVRWYFFVESKRLAQAMLLVRRELFNLGLVQQVKLGTADLEAEVWRTVVPE